MAGAARVHLVLVRHPGHVAKGDFEAVARRAEALEPRVRAYTLPDRRRRLLARWVARRPCLVFAAGALKHFVPRRGAVFAGGPLGKAAEAARLTAHGIPTPPLVRLCAADPAPDLGRFGPYVVVKPDLGGRGADVRIVRRGRVRWRPPRNRVGAQAGRTDLVAQDFVYTGPWPVSHRVVTLFGRALVAFRLEADRARPPLPDATAFDRVAGLTVVSNSRGCTVRLDADPEVVALAERAHQAFPDRALLGVDVVREVPSGRLFVIEVNSGGFTWHLSSPHAQEVARATGESPYAQMDGLERAAEVLALKAVELAS